MKLPKFVAPKKRALIDRLNRADAHDYSVQRSLTSILTEARRGLPQAPTSLHGETPLSTVLGQVLILVAPGLARATYYAVNDAAKRLGYPLGYVQCEVALGERGSYAILSEALSLCARKIGAYADADYVSRRTKTSRAGGPGAGEKVH